MTCLHTWRSNHFQSSTFLLEFNANTNEREKIHNTHTPFLYFTWSHSFKSSKFPTWTWFLSKRLDANDANEEEKIAYLCFQNIRRHIPLDIGFIFQSSTLVPSWDLHRLVSYERVVGNTNEQKKNTSAYLFVDFYSSTIPVEIWHQIKSYKTRCEYKRTRKHRLPLFFPMYSLQNFGRNLFSLISKRFFANTNEWKILPNGVPYRFESLNVQVHSVSGFDKPCFLQNWIQIQTNKGEEKRLRTFWLS